MFSVCGNLKSSSHTSIKLKEPTLVPYICHIYGRVTNGAQRGTCGTELVERTTVVADEG